MRQLDFHSRKNSEAWEQAVERGEGLLIGYLIAGDPSVSASTQLVHDAMEAGMDILEIGIPSRSPFLDGDIIRRGHARVMERYRSDEDWLVSYMQGVRGVTDNPIWAMGYREELIDTGLYVRLSQLGLIDALLLPDCGADEQRALQQTLAPYGVDVVRFVNQSMSDEELAHVCDGATVIYAQSYHGTTGNPFAQLQDLAGLCSRIERYTPALKVVGFGLRSPERVQAAIASGFDGAVVGSAFVIRCEHGAQDSLYRLIAEMKELAGPLVEKED